MVISMNCSGCFTETSFIRFLILISERRMQQSIRGLSLTLDTRCHWKKLIFYSHLLSWQSLNYHRTKRANSQLLLLDMMGGTLILTWKVTVLTFEAFINFFSLISHWFKAIYISPFWGLCCYLVIFLRANWVCWWIFISEVGYCIFLKYWNFIIYNIRRYVQS